MPKTFKNLQDEALEWMADEGDAGLMRTLVKQALDKSHRMVLSSEQFDFMLSPRPRTLSVVANERYYVLPEDYLQGLYFFDPSRDVFLEEIPMKGLMEAEDGITNEDETGPTRFSVTSAQGVLTQPTTAGTVVVTPSGGNEVAANGVVVIGLDASGNQITEQLSSGSPWASLTSTNSFDTIQAIIKTGDTWTRTITVTRGVTLLTLLPAEFTKQYQLFELRSNPSQSASIEYRYYRKPQQLVYDHQMPDIPENFRDIILYDALLALQGYSRATEVELGFWSTNRGELMNQMRQTYQQARTLGSRQRYVRYIERI